MYVNLFIPRILSSPQAVLSTSYSSMNPPLPATSPTTTEPHTGGPLQGPGRKSWAATYVVNFPGAAVKIEFPQPVCSYAGATRTRDWEYYVLSTLVFYASSVFVSIMKLQSLWVGALLSPTVFSQQIIHSTRSSWGTVYCRIPNAQTKRRKPLYSWRLTSRQG